MRRNNKMAKVAKDIIDMELDLEMLEDLKASFFQMMRENGIKQGTRNESGNGISISNPEWTMCRVLFLDMVRSKLEWDFVIGGFDVPDDLKCY